MPRDSIVNESPFEENSNIGHRKIEKNIIFHFANSAVELLFLKKKKSD